MTLEEYKIVLREHVKKAQKTYENGVGFNDFAQGARCGVANALRVIASELDHIDGTPTPPPDFVPSPRHRTMDLE